MELQHEQKQVEMCKYENMQSCNKGQADVQKTWNTCAWPGIVHDERESDIIAVIKQQFDLSRRWRHNMSGLHRSCSSVARPS